MGNRVFYGLIRLAALAALLVAGAGAAAQNPWASYGIGGGGALFSVSLSPHAVDEIYLSTDMSSVFHSTDFGRNWDTLDFRRLLGGHNSHVRFTADPQVLYAIHVDDDLDYGVPVRSADGGGSWQALAGDPTEGEAWWLDADPRDTARVLLSSYTGLYFSADAGASFRRVYGADDLRIAGAFWGSAGVFVATQQGLLVSVDGGGQFSLDGGAGLPAGEQIVGFAAAEQDGTTRLLALTGESAWPGIAPSDMLWDYRGAYRRDWGEGGWQSTSGFGVDDGLYFAGMARNDVNTLYLAGGNRASYAPVVYRSTDGGATWQSVFQTEDNANIATGWCGDGGDEQWWFPEYAMGFGVSPVDARRAVITDLGFVHVTDDGGAGWRQAYVNPADQNPAGAATPTGRSYRGVGLQQTSVWWLHWSGADVLNAAYTDISGQRSSDGGLSWQAGSGLGLPHNSTYQIIGAPGGTLYAATSSVHDLYQSTYLSDARIDGGSGMVVYSTDAGAHWQTLHDFGHPVVWLALDPSNPSRLYASVVHSEAGGIYVSEDLHNGAGAQWRRLASPPRTQGHAFTIQVLTDGTLLASYSGHRDAAGSFTRRSGVFVSSDRGASWSDRSHSDMSWWTKDLVVDPHDPTQSTWLAAVFRHWGGDHEDVGGLYRTTDRGLSWARISDLARVESVTLDPADPNRAWLTTETEGLWQSENFQSAAPVFSQDLDYPFRHPVRVFVNPYDAQQIWVTSFGGGLRATAMSESGGGDPLPVEGPITLTGRLTDGAGNGLCGLVLANGSYGFSCGEERGAFELSAPLNAQKQITLFAFVDGLAPYRQVITPTTTAVSVNVAMQSAAGGSPAFTVASAIEPLGDGSGRVHLTGTVTQNGNPVCALVLANGSYLFSCGESLGLIDLTVPLDGEGRATLFVFADGFAPFKRILTPDDEVGGDAGGRITYTAGGRVYRVHAAEGAVPEDVSAGLDVLASHYGGADSLLNLSPDGHWMVLSGERGHPECAGWACLLMVDDALSSLEAVVAGSGPVHPEGFSAVASGGQLIVYTADGGAGHALDLWAVRRAQSGWQAPVNLTSASSFAYNSQPALSADGAKLVFECGAEPYHGKSVCEVGTDGSGFRVVLAPAAGEGYWMPDYDAAGVVVAESDAGGGERIRRAGPGGPTAIGDFNNDNGPCVLPDGRIASLWYRDDHDLKVMDRDGANPFVIETGQDVMDIGLGCGN